MGESVFWTNTENVLLLTQIRILSKFLISLSKMHTSHPPKKTHQIYMNLKNCLDLCQKNLNQSKYWILSPMWLTLSDTLCLLYPSTYPLIYVHLHIQANTIWLTLSDTLCFLYPSTYPLIFYIPANGSVVEVHSG